MRRHTGAVGGESLSRPVASSGTGRSGENGFVTHGELLRLAQRCHCHGIHTEPVISLCNPDKNFWVFKAVVYKSPKCRGFVGHGDAHPGNVSPLIFNNAEMRKAYGIGLCSLEELPPSALGPQKLIQLRRSLQSRSLFREGVDYANQSPRSQSNRKRKKASGRRSVPRSGGSLRTGRARA